jgi:hypothetical protein
MGEWMKKYRSMGVIALVLVSGCVAGSDRDGMSDDDKSEGSIDPASTDSDQDGLTDQEELESGTDPLTADSDGDGYLDGWEVAENTDPNDPSDVIYEGGWPYNPNKDEMNGPELDEAIHGIGEQFARISTIDQFGDAFDFYDFAGQGKYTLVDISTMWCEACNVFSEWISGDIYDHPYDKYWGNIRTALDTGQMQFVTILTQNMQGDMPSEADLDAWHKNYPNELIPVIAGPEGVDSTYAVLGWPSFYLLDENMKIVEGSDINQFTYWDALDLADELHAPI